MCVCVSLWCVCIVCVHCVCVCIVCMCVGVCLAPGCCMSPAYVCVHNVGVCVAGSSVGKGESEPEGRKRVCACMWCLRIYCVEVCVKELRNAVVWFTHTKSLLLGWGCC